MKKAKNIRAVGRAAGAAVAVLVIVSGVTFAILQSQQIKLTGNTIQTTTANLVLSQDGTNFTSSQAGFNFSNLVPGGAAMPLSGYSFYLKNAGGTPLAIKFAVSSTPSNLQSVDLSKVNIILTPSIGAPQSFSLQALISANATGGLSVTSPSQLNPGAQMDYLIQASMASDAITGPSATLGNIDFAFTGVALSN